MDNTLEPLPEEHAYHVGWTSYFDTGTGAENPYNPDSEKLLFEKWIEGQRTAKTVEESLRPA